MLKQILFVVFVFSCLVGIVFWSELHEINYQAPIPYQDKFHPDRTIPYGVDPGDTK